MDICLCDISALEHVRSSGTLLPELLDRPRASRLEGCGVPGGVELDDNAKTVTLDGEPVALTPKEYDILHFLMQNPGKVFSPAEIYRTVWAELPLNADNALAVHIRHIREKIEINPADPRYIKVVWGKGYKMEADTK